MQRLISDHAPEFTEVGITMAQAKVLVCRDGRGPSADDRVLRVVSDRHVVRERDRRAPRRARLLLGRTTRTTAVRSSSRRLPSAMSSWSGSASSTSASSASCSVGSMPTSSRSSTSPLEIFHRAIDRCARPHPHRHGEHARESSQPNRPQQAERHAPVRGRPVHRRHLGLGQPQAGAPAGHRLPGHHRRHAVPGCRLVGRHRAGRPSRSRAPSRGVPRLETVQSTSSNSISLVIAQFAYGTDVKDDRRDRGGHRQGQPAGRRRRHGPALNINASPVIVASIAATSDRRSGGRRARSRGRRSCPRSRPSKASRGPT